MRRTFALPSALLVAMLAAAGCEQDNRIARLQQEVTSLTARNDALKAQVQRLEQEVEQCNRQLSEMNRLPADRWALIPKAASIAVDHKSGLRTGKPVIGPAATQPAGPVDMFARVYVAVQDQNGTRIQATGPMNIDLFDMSKTPPATVGRYQLSPKQTLDSYRSGIVGDVYVVDMPLTATPTGDQATVRVQFTDYLTGKTFTVDATLTPLK